MDIQNVVKQKWFMPVALGVTGLSFILFLKKQGTDSNVQTYDSYSSVPGEKAEAITQGMYDMEERIKAGQLAYLEQMNTSLSYVTDQMKDIELKMKNHPGEQPTQSILPVGEPRPIVDTVQATMPAPIITPTPIVTPPVITPAPVTKPTTPAPALVTVSTKVIEDKGYVKIPKGATLSEIAKANGTTVSKIVALNPGKIKNPNLIYAGDTIRVK